MQKVEEYHNKKNNNEEIDDKNNNEEDNKKRPKRKTFRALINNKYFIREDRLYYKYGRIKNKIVEKKIPYKLETFIFYSCHVNKLTHYSLKRSKENLKKSDYYYEGISKHLLD